MSFSVKVAQFDAPFMVEMGQTILDAALALDLPYPHGCTAGNCGACKSDKLSGDIDLLPHSEFALTPEEAAAGKILACRAVPWSDCEVALVGDDELVAHAERHTRSRIDAIEHLAHDVVGLRLTMLDEKPMTYSAGQYATLLFDDLPPRDFSMANVPGTNELEFHLRVVPGGRVSGHAATNARIGDTLEVRGPFGAAYVREQHDGPVLLAGGGTGLAPMLAIADALLARNPARAITFYVAARDVRDLYAGARIDALAAAHPSLRVHRVLSDATGVHPHRSGTAAAAIAADATDRTGWKAYVAGPPAMVDTVVAELETQGLARRDIHADAFLPAPAEVTS
jgi:CDP-4-dehydro-6-deoxyglucose reductase/ferredoxin-NAD(P)+ reductase (naphthalene dioxygenase ferredoxin-specific)